MPDFSTFDLGDVYRSAGQINAMRDASNFHRLQQSAFVEEQARKDVEFQQNQQIENTRLLNAASAEISTDPSAASRWQPVLEQAGIIEPGRALGDNPAELQAQAKQIFASTTQALRAYSNSGNKDRRVQSTQILENGNIGLVFTDGTVSDTNTKAKPQIVVRDVNDIPTVISSTGAGSKITPLSTQSQEDAAAQSRAAAEASGKATGSGMAERALDLPAAKARLSRSTANFDRLATSARELLSNQNLWKAVGLGKGLSAIPSSAGADVKAAIENLQSQAGLAVLQDMRDNSKTGGAVGQVSNFEQQIFQSNISALGNLSQSPESFRRQLEKLIDFAEDSKTRFSSAFYETYPEIKQESPSALPDFTNMSDDELKRLAGGGQ